MLCTLGRSTTKQNSHYLVGCTWKGTDSMWRCVLRNKVLTDKIEVTRPETTESDRYKPTTEKVGFCIFTIQQHKIQRKFEMRILGSMQMT